MLFLLLFLPASSEAQIGVPAESVTVARTRPVVLVASGGISLGSYQAGVNWALVEFVRRSIEPNNRLPYDGRLELVAATGASAGNINSILGALEWCRPQLTSGPEESLYWKIWIPTGWDQLSVPRSARDTSDLEGLLSRRFFRSNHFGTITDFMSRQPRPGCGIPLGITLTKLEPDTVYLGSSIPVPTQRVAALLSTRVLSDGAAPRLTFHQPPEWADRKSLGSTVVLPSIADSLLALRDVFSLIEASSAFPIAFAPKLLSFYRPGYADATCPLTNASECVTPGSGSFIDGGVFDNNPLFLALEMYAKHVGSRGGTRYGQPAFLYVDPDAYRRPLADHRGVRESEDGARGVGALRQLFEGAVPAAQQYELQVLARVLAEDSVRAAWVKVSNRSYPVVGEHMMRFGAFLGRPFREYDFYVGVYDGLHMIARDFVCAGVTIDRLACIRDTKREFITARPAPIPLGGHAPFLLRRLYNSEYYTDTIGIAGFEIPESPDSARDIRVLLALFDANQTQLAALDSDRCTDLGFPRKIFCDTGFDVLLDEFASRLESEGINPPECTPRECDEEVEDTSFAMLMTNRAGFVDEQIPVLIRRLWQVERDLQNRHRANSEGLLELGEIAYRSYAVRFRRGLEVSPSTIPTTSSTWRNLGWALPYWISANVSSSGWEFGYLPSWHINDSWAAVAPIAPYVEQAHSLPGQRNAARLAFTGIGVQHRNKSLLLSTWQIGVGCLWPWRDGRIADCDEASWEGNNDARWAVDLAATLIANKIRIGVRVLPVRGSDSLYSGSLAGVTFGVSDANGILFWLCRQSPDGVARFLQCAGNE